MKFIYQMALIATLGILSGVAYADESSRQLHRVYPQESILKNPVSVKIQLKEDTLQIFFTILNPSIYAKMNLGPGQYLYQYDVVEIFLAPKKNKEHIPKPYYEFVLSPYNQFFQQKIVTTPNPVKVIYNINTGIEHSTQNITGGWTAEILIPLKKLGWEGNPCEITGNIFAILGEKPRTFWSLYLPPDSKPPNFHKLAYFKPLICSGSGELKQ